MKIFTSTTFKSIAAAVAVMLAGTAYATCQTDCAAYAQGQAERVRADTYSSVYGSCTRAGGNHNSCQPLALSNSQNAYSQSYTYYYNQCTANCA